MSQPPPYTLYIANKNYSSWSLRPWILMRHHSIPFTEQLVRFEGGHGGRQPHWKAFSPTASVPCLHHHLPSASSASAATSPPSSPPIMVWDSLAIVDYLSDLHPSLPIWPALDSTPASHHRRAWARSAVAEMHAGFATLRHEMYMNVGLRVEFRISDAAARQLARLDELWRGGLARFGGPFLAGAELGAVDAFFAPVVLRLQTYVGSVETLSAQSRGYVRRVLELGAMREWIAAALGEDMREGLHEEETVQGRKVIEDLRVAKAEEGD